MDGVKMFLSKLGMEKYYDMFKIKGFDDESDIPYLTTFDLQETILVTNQLDRMTILSNARLYRPGPEHAVHAWLCSNSLSYYFIGFIQSELTDLKKIAQLSLPNEDVYDELEILLPGHRKRLERAVYRLKLEQINDAAAETPISHGWWGKPECLPQAKFDFLCVNACLFSSRSPHKSATVDFMVDSGSDVSTVQENTLKDLNLELIGPVYSCGIHGGNHTNLYKGRLKIGDQELDIEVMGSNYDSLGSRVVRHFRHIIDGHRHIWLKGNYSDSLPAIASIEFPVASSQLPQHSDRLQAVLPNADVNDFEASPESLQQVTRPLDSKNNSETQKMHQTSTSTIMDKPPTDHHDDNHPGEPTSHIQSPDQARSKHPANIDSQEKIHISKKLHLSSHSKQSSVGSKGKQSLKHRYKDLKTSINRKHPDSQSAFPESSVPRPSRGTGNTLQSINSEVYNTAEGIDLDSVEENNAAGQSDSNARLGERVSLFSTLTSSLRDTDDDVDHLGDHILRSPTLCRRSQVANDHFIEMAEDLHFESDVQKKSSERVSCETSHQAKPCDSLIGFNDVIHVTGLNIESAINNGDVDDSVEVNTNGDRVAMVFIPACNEVKEIQLIELDKTTTGGPLGATQFDTNNHFKRKLTPHSEDSCYTSPKKCRFEQS